MPFLNNGEAGTIGIGGVMEGDIRILRALLGLSMAVPVLSGCATVTVDTSAGTISARGIFGTETLPLAPAAVRVHGFGVFRTAYSVSVGWQSETSIYISGTNGC